ncbi:MAG: dTDP-4-dehydrorhamnose reductase [Candidatus Woesearchaeota archaeon]
MKILVIGSNGMLGHDVCAALRNNNIEFQAFNKNDLDITNKDQINEKINNSFSHIINCAAYTDVDGAESNNEDCDKINVLGTKNLADKSKQLKIPLITISTDYVFNGEKQEYTEDEQTNPINYYGLSKKKAEDYIKQNLKKYYIIRTSWLFGKNGKNFVKTIKNLTTKNQEIKVVNDQHGCPTYTIDLANAIIKLINDNKNYGIYHLTNSNPCTWYEFAKEIIKLTNSNCKVIPCTSDEFQRKTKRPKYSILRNNKTSKLPDWKDALKRYLEE